jgi:hypothetical protein
MTLAAVVVRPYERGLAVQPHESRQRQDHILRPEARADLDRQTLAGVFIDHAKHLQRPPVYQLVMHEVAAPDRIGLRGAWQAYVVATTTSARTASRKIRMTCSSVNRFFIEFSLPLG